MAKSQNESIKNVVFRVLHQPPREYGFNRTTWRMQDLREAIKQNGQSVSWYVIRKIVRAAGYRWRKAKKRLTSNDPCYTEKVARLRSVLSSLSSDEAFFSIDEFGPFYVRMTGGWQLMPSYAQKVIPSGQKHKGRIILTAALELSSNQVTHFYSSTKNTSEMIKMIDILRKDYRNKNKIYVSWDAAVWHTSTRLRQRVDEYNRAPSGEAPCIELVPLPARAQFLNVIESVFSGMCRAVIHNSDYPNIYAAKDAIDSYFRERNEHFIQFPHKAGKKIWKIEREPAVFSDCHNCKDPSFSW